MWMRRRASTEDRAVFAHDVLADAFTAFPDGAAWLVDAAVWLRDRILEISASWSEGLYNASSPLELIEQLGHRGIQVPDQVLIAARDALRHENRDHAWQELGRLRRDFEHVFDEETDAEIAEEFAHWSDAYLRDPDSIEHEEDLNEPERAAYEFQVPLDGDLLRKAKDHVTNRSYHGDDPEDSDAPRSGAQPTLAEERGVIMALFEHLRD
jgi:hypothetical protein